VCIPCIGHATSGVVALSFSNWCLHNAILTLTVSTAFRLLGSAAGGEDEEDRLFSPRQQTSSGAFKSGGGAGAPFRGSSINVGPAGAHGRGSELALAGSSTPGAEGGGILRRNVQGGYSSRSGKSPSKHAVFPVEDDE
jgi:hypothetical protein